MEDVEYTDPSAPAPAVAAPAPAAAAAAPSESAEKAEPAEPTTPATPSPREKPKPSSRFLTVREVFSCAFYARDTQSPDSALQKKWRYRSHGNRSTKGTEFS